MPHTPFSNLSIGDECCFLCGTSNTITQEHVFPKWLQQRYNLWNQTIELLNGSTINYRRLKIPCCSTCNNEDLSRLESMIASGVTTGYEACLGIGERSFYLWVGKLFFGILRKEIQLAANRARPDDGPILPADVLERFSNLHRFLQGIRARHQFSGKVPYSVLITNLHDLGPPNSYCFRKSCDFMYRIG